MAGLLRSVTGAFGRLLPPPVSLDRSTDSSYLTEPELQSHRRSRRFLRAPSDVAAPPPTAARRVTTTGGATTTSAVQAGSSPSSDYSEDDARIPAAGVDRSASGGLGAGADAGAGEPLELPRVVWHANPRIALKLRKRFFPLGVTRLTLGADVDLQSRDVRLKWSWKDRIIGGRLRLDGSQLSLSKRFDIDSRTHMYVRGAYDIRARRALLSLDVKPFRGFYATGDSRPPGLALKQKVPVDKRVTMEVLARVQLPEARFSTQNSVSLGEGDFVIDVEELNFKFMLQ